MNKLSDNNLWAFKNKFVSWLVIAILVSTVVTVLFPLSLETVSGYSMPAEVSWDMDDLVTNSSGAVTSSGGGVYNVHEDISVPVNSSLSVFAGETVKFDLTTGFTVYGSFSASGTNIDLVTFTSNDANPSFGDWDGIKIENGSGTLNRLHITYAEEGISLINTSIAVSNSYFGSNVWGLHVQGGNSEIFNNTFISNGILPHPDPALSVGGGVFLEDSYYGFVEDNEFSINIGGIKSESSYVYIYNNFIYNSTVYGIYSTGEDSGNQSFSNIIGNEISFNQNFGIYSSTGRELYVYTNNITYNRVGIYLEGSLGGVGGGGSIYTNLIAHNMDHGIEAYGTSGSPPFDPGLYISGNEIMSNGDAGIYLEDSTANIQTNEIIGNTYGVYSSSSTVTILYSLFNSNQYAVWANASEVDITDSEILKSTWVDFYLENETYATSLNATFNDYAVIFGDDLSTLEVRWYLHVIVINGSGPVDSADVTVTDNENGTWSESFVTDSVGRVKWINVLEYIRTQISWVFYTPHNITASKESEVGYAEPLMDISKFVFVDITSGPIPQSPLPPVDLEITLLGTDLQLSWGASGDDGAGENDVVSYEIYRSMTIDGSYVNVGSVSADGSPTYTWTDSGKGDSDWNNYFYIVRAKDSEGLEDVNENKVGKFVSYLDERWNLFSAPLIQGDTSRDKVLETLGTNYVTVQGYHAGKSRPWLHWHRNKPNRFNDVIEINRKEGYYIDMITPDYLVTVGKVATSTEITMKTGWNLIGFPSLSNRLRDDALSSISGKYNKVERYDTTLDKEVRLDSGDFMEPGLGYWIHTTEDCVLTITN
jgi:parallel beta-helix repeat protein